MKKKITDDLDKQINHKVNQYYKELGNLPKIHQQRAESVALRKKWIEAQKRQNYENEYHRIRANLDTLSVFPFTADRKRLKDRKKEGIELGAKATRGFKII